jgi:hypothetical protein
LTAAEFPDAFIAAALIEDAADAALTLIREGLARAQDRHNRTAPPKD